LKEIVDVSSNAILGSSPAQQQINAFSVYLLKLHRKKML